MAEFQIYWAGSILWIKSSVCSIYNVLQRLMINSSDIIHHYFNIFFMIVGIVLPFWGARIFQTHRDAKPKALFTIKGRKFWFWLFLLYTYYWIYVSLAYDIDLFRKVFFLGAGLYLLLTTSSMDILILEEGIYYITGKVIPWAQVDGFSEIDIFVLIKKNKGISKVIPIAKFGYKINKNDVERLRSLHQKKIGTVEQRVGADRK